MRLGRLGALDLSACVKYVAYAMPTSSVVGCGSSHSRRHPRLPQRLTDHSPGAPKRASTRPVYTTSPAEPHTVHLGRGWVRMVLASVSSSTPRGKVARAWPR